ncbi:MAG: hypothetical protein IT464_00545 [Planctomycetes bacterium]|nr:hypothetical protein [Planctomycetota bacterium]
MIALSDDRTLHHGVQTPAAYTLLLIAVLSFGAAWGLQLILATSAIRGLETQPQAYWFVYSLLAGAGAAGLWAAYRTLRQRIALMLSRRTHRASLSASEVAGQYLLRRETRERNRPLHGIGGPCPQHWVSYLQDAYAAK